MNNCCRIRAHLFSLSLWRRQKKEVSEGEEQKKNHDKSLVDYCMCLFVCLRVWSLHTNIHKNQLALCYTSLSLSRSLFRPSQWQALCLCVCVYVYNRTFVIELAVADNHKHTSSLKMRTFSVCCCCFCSRVSLLLVLVKLLRVIFWRWCWCLLS